jgi:hypothetical protein
MADEFLRFEAQDGLNAVLSQGPGMIPAWTTLDFTRLYGKGKRIGDNRPVPGVTGRIVVPKEFDQLELTLTMRVKGFFTHTGARADDPFVEAATTLLYLRQHVLDYTPARSVTFGARTGTEYAGELVIENWTNETVPESGGETILVFVDISVPAGYLVP